MNKNITFKRKLIATAVTSAALAGMSSMTYAQEDPMLEEVVVTGIRASLEQAMDIKRDSVGVVDAISAEDIGKMPDANLAESLQRIAGVSITRNNGEGARVTVRGIDPGMNMVTLNGRNMPAVTNDGGAGDRASRAFDFASLASESVSGVEVYKTGKAHVSGGGLGATVNLKTVRPLDVADNKASIGVKAVEDTTVHRGDSGNQLTPEVSGIFSWANDDSTFGVALSATYQERDNVRSNAFVNNWQLREVDANGVHGSTPEGATINNPLAAGSLYAIPTDLRYALEENHRERTNGQLTLQYRPVESLTATVDYTYAEFDLDATRAQQSTWYNESAITSMTFDSGQEVHTPVIYVESYPGGANVFKDSSFAQQKYNGTSRMESAGLNLSWDVTDNFNLALDYHDSKARNVTTQTELGLNANITVGEYSDWRSDFPIMGIEIDDSNPNRGNDNGVLDGGDMSSAMGSARWDTQETTIEQLKLDGSLDLGGFAFFNETEISFGVEDRTDNNHTLMNNGESPRITMGNWGGVDPDTFGPDWPNYFSPRDFAEGFPSFSDETDDPNFFNGGLDGDIDKLIGNLEWVYQRGLSDPAIAANFFDFPNGKVQPNEAVTLNRNIQEEVFAYYAAFHGAFDIGGMASNLVIGLRQEETDLTSVSIFPVPVNQSWDGDNDFSLIYEPGIPDRVVSMNSYDNFLPNVDFDISLTEDVKLRLSYSETIARPTYDDLSSATTVGNQYLRQAERGNPLLTPLESTNFDVSAEWYYGESSYMSVALFHKEVSDFIGTTVVDEPVFDLRDPRNGERFEQAIADIEALRADGELTRHGDLWNPDSELHQHDMMLINEGLDPAEESTFILANSTDPVQTWRVTTPSNFRDDTISGAELSIQHWFGDSGFGIQANYTFVESDLEVDNTSDEEQFAMLGVSDTANAVLLYDRDRLQARIAYNWRDSYLASLAQGGNNAPGYVDEYSQIDFSISYEITDNLTLSAEGLNVTGEDSRLYGRSERQMFSLEDRKSVV